MVKNFFFDFNSDLYFDHSTYEGMVNEFRKNCFRSIARAFSVLRIFKMRRPLPRRIQGQEFFLPEPVFSYGICSVDTARESSRYRNLPAGYAIETVPHRLSWNHLPQHTRECQRTARLAYLRRLCTDTYRYRPSLIRKRGFRSAAQKDGVRTRFNHRRFMPIIIPMGKVQTQSTM